jgi:hypothetical protein
MVDCLSLLARSTPDRPRTRRSAICSPASPASTAPRPAAIGTAEIRKLVATCVGSLIGKRDRARAEEAGLAISALKRLSTHGLRAGFVTKTYRAGAYDEQIMAHIRHRDLRMMRSPVRRAKLLTESSVRLLGL